MKVCGLITTERNTPALGKVFMAPFVISKILNIANGEGNGNLLRCSCLENPRDGGAWWAAVYAVTKSRTRLK